MESGQKEESIVIPVNFACYQDSFESFTIGIPTFTYEIMLNHAFAYAWHRKNSPSITRFARWCLLFPCNLDMNCGWQWVNWAIERTHTHTHAPRCENKWGYISIDEYDKWKWAACQNLLLLSLLIRYVQHDGTPIGNLWIGNGLAITHGILQLQYIDCCVCVYVSACLHVF